MMHSPQSQSPCVLPPWEQLQRLPWWCFPQTSHLCAQTLLCSRLLLLDIYSHPCARLFSPARKPVWVCYNGDAARAVCYSRDAAFYHGWQGVRPVLCEFHQHGWQGD